jgi:hypothetical protein
MYSALLTKASLSGHPEGANGLPIPKEVKKWGMDELAKVSRICQEHKIDPTQALVRLGRLVSKDRKTFKDLGWETWNQRDPRG